MQVTHLDELFTNFAQTYPLQLWTSFRIIHSAGWDMFVTEREMQKFVEILLVTTPYAPHFVAPAYAGVQSMHLKQINVSCWIPAFAGMTKS